MGRLITNKLQQFFFCCSLLFTGFLTSCSDQSETTPDIHPDGDGYEVSLDAIIGEPVGTSAKGMTRVATSEDAMSGLKTTWVNDDKLTVAYTSGGRLKIAELSVKLTNGNSATFHGSVESSSDAQAFKTSTLYAVNNKASDKIDASVTNGKLKVSVELSGQNGTAENVANYDLLYAKGTAATGLQFSHKMSVVRMDFVRETAAAVGNSVTNVAFAYVPTVSIDKSIFASSATFEFGGSTETSGYDGLTFFTLSSISRPYKNGKSSVYAVDPANEKLTGELSVKVGGNNGNNFRKYLNINGKAFPAQNVVAKTIKLSAADQTPNIGDYLYSDGTWGPLKYYTNKYPVALVFSNYTSRTDRDKGYKHGYAVALRDAAWPTPWGPDNADYPEAANLFEHIDATAPLAMMNNLDGLTICETLNNKYLHSYTYENYYQHNGKKAAIPLAMEYGSYWWQYAYSNIPAVPAPAGTSGWYLPSMGQWYLMFANLSGLDPNKLYMARESGSGNVYSLSWLFNSANERNTYLTKFSNYFSSYSNPILSQYYNERRIPQAGFYFPSDGQIHWYLWASDEAKSNGTACCVRLTQTEIGFTYLDKRQGTTSNNGYAARSVIAF